MRAKLNLRSRRAQVAAGALFAAVSAAAVATQPAVSHANTAGAPGAAHHATIGTSAKDASPADRAAAHTTVTVRVNRHRSKTSPGHTIVISGHVSAAAPKLPVGTVTTAAAVVKQATADARVKLQMLRDGRWVLAQHHRTNGTGHFSFGFRVLRPGVTHLRVLYLTNPVARYRRASAGYISSQVPLYPVVASWYYDAGNTACGFHAFYGVANKTLPCGTKVTIAYGGHSVVATVDDRGPYVAGRTYDLNQNVSRALGMGGVATVRASIG